ncbi:hypothetical protein EVAR_99397_1 [Eumeta japonica]|uniref:Uncharacterized protein n=1 Tax=Eumeta variegata TaxID=151549 RepID=A0A4C1SSE8_EUMVA|nr:hypothetical protein EVAR_99397_1 [Eumeta japonica]
MAPEVAVTDRPADNTPKARYKLHECALHRYTACGFPWRRGTSDSSMRKYGSSATIFGGGCAAAGNRGGARALIYNQNGPVDVSPTRAHLAALSTQHTLFMVRVRTYITPLSLALLEIRYGDVVRLSRDRRLRVVELFSGMVFIT